MKTSSLAMPSVGIRAGKTHPWGLPGWFQPSLKALVIEVFFLIALGGAVRIMNAGLACPDWPLCFGDFIPDYHPQVYLEFIHRALAGVISIATAILVFTMAFRSNTPLGLKRLGLFVAALLLVQVIFGGLTVLWQLHSKVVAAHLGMGTAFFAIMLGLYLRVKEPRPPGASPRIQKWTMFVTAAVFGQLILGGLVASHFASLVCTDFPTCHGQWFPTFSGIIGLHVIHRLGAYTLFVVILINLLVMYRSEQPDRLKKLSLWMFGLVCLQIGIGIANVLLHTPPLVAVAHLAVATLLLSICVRQMHFANVLPIRSAVQAG